MKTTLLTHPKVKASILDCIGNTPLVYLERFSISVGFKVFAKLEGANPGQSAKDRIALSMVDAMEADGRLHPGGTVIETTSGNTGFALAMICAVRGYRCILVTNDKISKAKLDALKALGAAVEICPSKVPAEDPRSYYEVAKSIHAKTPNSVYINQYFHPGNPDAHYHTTGPEIWEQTGGQVTHYVAPVGTGGTISGTSRYLKEQNPNVETIGIDAYGSVLTKYHETGEFDENEIYPYLLEGVGKNIIPSNVHFDLIDQMTKVGDRESALEARDLAKTEGILVGFSSGAVLAGIRLMAQELPKESVVVAIMSDHGCKYFEKIFNDEWMEEKGLL
jgi:cystathionine beta-synthase